MNDFGKEVRKKCIDLGVTQHYVAESIGLSDNGLSNALNRDNLGLLQMQKIANALNCELKIQLVPKKGE